LVQNDAVLIGLKQNKEGQMTYHLFMLIFFLKKPRIKAGFAATLQSLFLPPSLPKTRQRNIPPHTILYSYLEKTKALLHP